MATAGAHTHDRDDSREAEVFRQHYDQLVIAIQNPESLADRLFSRKVIGRDPLQKMQLVSLTKTKKSREVLLAVLDQLVVNPCKFSEVVEALQSDSTLESAVEKLQSVYCKCVVCDGSIVSTVYLTYISHIMSRECLLPYSGFIQPLLAQQDKPVLL